METKFNVFEVLEIAEQIEHNGATFYLKAAELFSDPELRDTYYMLATWKARHEKLWVEMRKRFSEKTGEFGTFDPDNYVLSNPEVMAGLTWFGTKRGSAGRLTGKETKAEILRDAIRRANEAAIFYSGLKDFARDPASEETIDKIIGEEKRQIRQLTEELAKTL
ncbi:MAG: ferritin family protein [Phycisphaerales bacterium]|nr:MAG: ferritin family protein [Phycisphaerales bacterium]